MNKFKETLKADKNRKVRYGIYVQGNRGYEFFGYRNNLSKIKDEMKKLEGVYTKYLVIEEDLTNKCEFPVMLEYLDRNIIKDKGR